MIRRVQISLEWHLRTGWFARVVREAVLSHPFVFGPPDRLHVGKDCNIAGVTLNTVSGRITIGDHTFLGHQVSLLTGTHDYSQRNQARLFAIPTEGRDIVIGEGVWIASNSTVLGPCRIGDHAVVAAGAVVTTDVPERTIVAGVPAKPVGQC